MRRRRRSEEPTEHTFKMTVMDLRPLADAISDATPDALARGEAAFCLLHEEGIGPNDDDDDECLIHFVDHILDDVAVAIGFAEKYGCHGVGTLFAESLIEDRACDPTAPGEAFFYDMDKMQAKVWMEDRVWYETYKKKPFSEFAREALVKGWYDDPDGVDREEIERGLATMGITRV